MTSREKGRMAAYERLLTSSLEIPYNYSSPSPPISPLSVPYSGDFFDLDSVEDTRIRAHSYRYHFLSLPIHRRALLRYM
jgi:hypothetical protein